MAAKIRVLCVDDEPAFAETVADFLRNRDDRFNVTTATSAQVALSLINERSIHCVVSDYQMPKMDGIDFLSAVRGERPGIPFILYTGKGSESIASDAINAGVTDYLQKGSGTDTYDLLENRIKNAVESYRNERALRETQTRFRLLVEESTDSIFIVARDGTLEYASPVADRHTGHPADELVGTNITDYVHPDDLERTRQQFAWLVEHPEERMSLELRFERESGPPIHVEARGRNLLSHPMISGIVVYVRENPV